MKSNLNCPVDDWEFDVYEILKTRGQTTHGYSDVGLFCNLYSGGKCEVRLADIRGRSGITVGVRKGDDLKVIGNLRMVAR